ncbi:MAG: hypothetical protein WDN67_00435 [Candidatus Moraniibacteriota bacterium]
MAIFNKRKQDSEEGFFAKLIGSFVSILFIGKLNTFFVELLLSAREITDDYIRTLIRRFSILLSAVVGVIFLLTGLAQYLSHTFPQVAGSGSLLVGGTLVLLSFVWYFIPGKK